jgi:hypothetical protein
VSDNVICDEFLLPEGQTPCGAVVAFPEQHKAFHAFLEGWMAWLITAGKEAYKKDKDKGDADAPPDAPATPDRKIRY